MNNNIFNLFKEENLNSCKKLSNFIENNFKTVFIFSPITVAFYNEDKTLSLFLNKKTPEIEIKLISKDKINNINVNIYIAKNDDKTFISKVFNKYIENIDFIEKEIPIENISLMYNLIQK